MQSPAIRRFFTATLLAGLLLTGGCSTFERDWDAAAGFKPQNRTDITGRWQGTWASEASGHSGGLRCLITRINDHTYEARYHATYAGIFHFCYGMDLTAVKQQEWVRFEGSADLGWLAGGVYHYDGHATADNFFSNYQCSQDHGTFVMKRPE